MTISVDQLAKRFAQHYIFRGLSLQLALGHSYALLGANGSGKSTLLRIIAGMQSPTKGSVQYHNAQGTLIENPYQHISFCAPGMELIEELTLAEMLRFHFRFKPILPGHNIASIIDTIGLQAAQHKPLADYSSGMRQRVKLAQAIFAHTPILMLDEPCTNLDHAGVAQYRQWIANHSQDRLLIIASNEEREYDFCQQIIKMEDYK